MKALPQHTDLRKFFQTKMRSHKPKRLNAFGITTSVQIKGIETGTSVENHSLSTPSTGNWQDGSDEQIYGPGGPSYLDIAQLSFNDCYLLAVLLGLTSTAFGQFYLTSEILQPAHDSNGIQIPHRWWVFFRRQNVITRIEVEMKINTLQGTVSPSTYLWWFLIERAYAFFRTGVDDLLGLDYGQAMAAMQDLGLVITSSPFAVGSIEQALNQGQIVVLNTNGNVPDWIIPNHSETCLKVEENTCTLANPWGINSNPPSQTPILRFPTFTNLDTITYYWNFTSCHKPTLHGDIPQSSRSPILKPPPISPSLP